MMTDSGEKAPPPTLAEAVELLKRGHPPTTPDKDLWAEWLADVGAFMERYEASGSGSKGAQMQRPDGEIPQVHELPVEALLAVQAVPYDPVTQYIGHRWEGCNALFDWLRYNGWRLMPPAESGRSEGASLPDRNEPS